VKNSIRLPVLTVTVTLIPDGPFSDFSLRLRGEG
jgi:hypothetical protein